MTKQSTLQAHMVALALTRVFTLPASTELKVQQAAREAIAKAQAESKGVING